MTLLRQGRWPQRRQPLSSLCRRCWHPHCCSCQLYSLPLLHSLPLLPLLLLQLRQWQQQQTAAAALRTLQSTRLCCPVLAWALAPPAAQ